ncbi:hypothetical protein ACFLZ0_00945 [Patescibacteria group bacterium]
MKIIKNKKFIKFLSSAVLVLTLVCLVAPVALAAETKIISGDIDDIVIEDVLRNTINWGLGLLVLICTILIIWAGFTYMTATGDDTKQGSARKVATGAVVGLIIAVLAYAIINTVLLGLFEIS